MGEAGDIAQGPGRAEQATLARIHLGEAHSLVVRVGRGGCAIGVLARRDGAGAHPIRLVADERLGRFDDIGQGFEGLHYGDVVGGMDDGTRRMGDEIQQFGRRPLAVELGEEGEHAAAKRDPGEGAARGAINLGKRRSIRSLAAGQHGFQVDRRGDSDRRRQQSGLLDRGADAAELGIGRRFARQQYLQHDRGPGRFAQPAIVLQRRGNSALSAIDVTDEMTGRGRLDHPRGVQGCGGFLAWHRHADLRQLARGPADLDIDPPTGGGLSRPRQLACKA